MKTINDIKACEKAQTISEIAGIEINTEGWDFLSKPYCHLILKKTDELFYIKFEADTNDIASLSNGYYKVLLDDGFVWEAVQVKGTHVVEDFKF